MARFAAWALVATPAVLCAVVIAQPSPSTRPAGPATRNLPADQLLNQMLKPSEAGAGRTAAQPLQPTQAPPAVDATSGVHAIAPGAQPATVIREGTFLVDRTGRLTRNGDSPWWEFNFDSDGRAMQDAPVIILPNLKLMAMEQAVRGANRDLRFRITGVVTEYNGRNYILLEKVVVVPDVTQQF